MKIAWLNSAAISDTVDSMDIKYTMIQDELKIIVLVEYAGARMFWN